MCYIRKIATGPGNYYMTSWLLDYNDLNEYHKMIAIDLSKQQELDVDPKGIQQIIFTGNLTRVGNANTTFFCYWRTKRNHFIFFTKDVKILRILFYFNIISVQNDSI